MLITIFIDSLILGIICGLTASIYRGVLAYEGILNWWFRFGARFEGKWFYRPIWECEKCFAGQLALWTYLLLHLEVEFSTQRGGFGAVLPVSAHLQGYHLIGHIFGVMAAIFTAPLFMGVINKHK